MIKKFNFTAKLLDGLESSLDQVAVIDNTRTVTYREFQQLIKTAAANFCHQGLRPGDRYIIMMPDCIEWLAAFLGGIYIGAVPVLLPTNTTPERCRQLVIKSQSSVLICTKDTIVDLSATDCTQISEILHPVQGVITEIHLFDPKEPSLWLLSSGTGGALPKSVIHSHQSIQTSVDMLVEFYGSNSKNCVFSTAKLSFQYGLFNVLYGLTQHATVILNKYIPSTRTVCDLTHNHQVTQLFSTPGVLLSLAKAKTRPHSLDSVDILVTAGEVLIEHVESKILEKYGKKIYNSYGMSEAIITIVGQNHQHNKFQTIGIPFPNVKVKIVDENLANVPNGTIGEILIHTPTRALEYHNEPDATARAFLGNGWYRSNDLGYIDSEGMICYVGRKNDCFKINGMFVSPAEVENAIIKYPGIDDCMVASMQRNDGKLIVVANILLEDPNNLPKSGHIQTFLSSLIEKYKIPSIINFVTEIPNTPTTKKIRSKIVC